MPRLFTALSIPQDVSERLSALRGGLAGARWIDLENYHITLRFFGDVSAAVARDIDEELVRIGRPHLSLGLERLGVFGGDKPRAIVARIRSDPALSALQADHERAARKAGLTSESRKFTPHITLARTRAASAFAAANWLESRSWFHSEAFRADRFVLVSSRASVGGGPYIVEAEYPLGVAAVARPASAKR